MKTVGIAVRQLPHAADLPLPRYATDQSAGMDLLAAVTADLEIGPGSRVLVPTGLEMALPPGVEAQIRPRSGLALRYGLTVLNSPGTIDPDYRGEVRVLLVNLGREPVTITRGMRIAQLVVASYATVTWETRPSLDATPRGDGGFGSTGQDV